MQQIAEHCGTVKQWNIYVNLYDQVIEKNDIVQHDVSCNALFPGLIWIKNTNKITEILIAVMTESKT